MHSDNSGLRMQWMSNSFNSFKYLLFGEDSKIYNVSADLARYLAKETPVLPSPMIRGILFNFENLP